MAECPIEPDYGITPDQYLRLECARMVCDRNAVDGQNAERARELYRFVTAQEAGQ